MKILNMAATICLAFAMVTAAKWWWSFYSDPRFNRKVNEKVKEKLAYPKEKLDQTYVWLKAQIKAQLEDDNIDPSMEKLVFSNTVEKWPKDLWKRSIKIPELKVLYPGAESNLNILDRVPWDSLSVHRLCVFARKKDVKRVEKFLAGKNFTLVPDDLPSPPWLL